MNIFSRYTLNTLKKNKTRTLVTLVGILLSVAMLTAVTSFIASLQNFLLEDTIAREGNWHGQLFGIEDTGLAELRSQNGVELVSALQELGYAMLEEYDDPSRPYLYVSGYEENFFDSMPIRLVNGQMPVNAGEVLLPTSLANRGGVFYPLGTELTLTLGERRYEGETLDQNNPCIFVGDRLAEQFTAWETRTFTVVGTYEASIYEAYRAPAYVLLTPADPEQPLRWNPFVRMENPKEIYTLAENYPANGCTYHSDLLRFQGSSNENSLNNVLRNLALILMSIIMLASISLIYNAFSISVSERTRQFGLMSSIGATKRQLRRSVYFEALLLSSIGIPLGILSGLLGIGITLNFLGGTVGTLFSGQLGQEVECTLVLSWPAIGIAAAVGLITVLISAWIPAHRASRQSAVEALRQAADIRIPAHQVRTSPLVYRLFSFEGMLASKNFRRNRRRYRATVISLFLSVVLFISTSAFCAYLESSAGQILDQTSYDLSYYCDSEEESRKIYSLLKEVDGVQESSWQTELSVSVPMTEELQSEEYRNYKSHVEESSATASASALLLILDEESYQRCLEQNGISAPGTSADGLPAALWTDYLKYYNPAEEKYYTMRGLKSGIQELTTTQSITIEGYYLDRMEETPDGEAFYYYVNVGTGKEKALTAKEALLYTSLPLGQRIDTLPMIAESLYGGAILLIYPESALPALTEALQPQAAAGYIMCFRAKDHQAVYDDMYRLLSLNGCSTYQLYDLSESMETNRAVLFTLNVFSYGFIILISLIATANVFNTIATNIQLRRREFAMLKSVGMTRKGFRRLMNFECLLYGLKSLLYGLPVAFGLCWLIYFAILEGISMDFFLPWNSVAVAVASVFLVIFATMLYAMGKIQKENTIDALKDENA